jgi:hypothetical protein
MATASAPAPQMQSGRVRIAVRIAALVGRQTFAAFMAEFRPTRARSCSTSASGRTAVLENVGSQEFQTRMLANCLWIARRGIFLTTPKSVAPGRIPHELSLPHCFPTTSIARSIGR